MGSKLQSIIHDIELQRTLIEGRLVAIGERIRRVAAELDPLALARVVGHPDNAAACRETALVATYTRYLEELKGPLHLNAPELRTEEGLIENTRRFLITHIETIEQEGPTNDDILNIQRSARLDALWRMQGIIHFHLNLPGVVHPL